MKSNLVLIQSALSGVLKGLIFLVIMLAGSIYVHGQQLEVEGDSKIKGKLAVGDHTATQAIDARGATLDDAALLLLGNSDLSHKLFFFPGRTGDPLPFIQWKEGDPLRFATDEGNFSEKLIIASDGTITVFNRITNIADPIDGRDAATKSYVDLLLVEIDWLKGLLGIGEVTDSEGNVYPTIQIGSQFWMAKNLNVGTRIEGSNNQTNNSAIEKYCHGDMESNCDVYGGLYQWDEMMQYVTVEGAQGLCPIGWHVPSDGDWTVLTNYLGGTGIAGGKMKEAGLTHWNSPNRDATNESGFTGLPGGFRNTDGSFFIIGSDGDWWSSTELPVSSAWVRFLNASIGDVGGSTFNKGLGLSVRCVRD